MRDEQRALAAAYQVDDMEARHARGCAEIDDCHAIAIADGRAVPVQCDLGALDQALAGLRGVDARIGNRWRADEGACCQDTKMSPRDQNRTELSFRICDA